MSLAVDDLAWLIGESIDACRYNIIEGFSRN